MGGNTDFVFPFSLDNSTLLTLLSLLTLLTLLTLLILLILLKEQTLTSV
jgi:hypothetical protein